MNHLEELNALIDKAAEKAGSDYKLAAMLGMQRQKISNMRHGRMTATPEDQALFASVAGLNAIEVLARAMVQKHEGTPKGDRLMRALGKGLLATGAAVATAGANAAAIFSSIHPAKTVVDLIRCIKLLNPFGLVNSEIISKKAPV